MHNDHTSIPFVRIDPNIDESNSVPPEIPEIEEDSEGYSSSEDVVFGSMFD